MFLSHLGAICVERFVASGPDLGEGPVGPKVGGLDGDGL
jgi:hypothetical protein